MCVFLCVCVCVSDTVITCEILIEFVIKNGDVLPMCFAVNREEMLKRYLRANSTPVAPLNLCTKAL